MIIITTIIINNNNDNEVGVSEKKQGSGGKLVSVYV